MNISGHHNICKTVGLPFKPFFFFQQNLILICEYYLSVHSSIRIGNAIRYETDLEIIPSNATSVGNFADVSLL